MKEDFKELKKIDKEVKYLNNHILRVGVLGNESTDGVKVKDYAVYVEYGTLHIPSRPFFRSVVSTKKGRDKISRRLKTEIGYIIKGTKTGEQVLESVGIYTLGLIQESILKGNWTPNAESTLKNKNSSRPLVDTTTMLKSISWEIIRR